MAMTDKHAIVTTGDATVTCSVTSTAAPQKIDWYVAFTGGAQFPCPKFTSDLDHTFDIKINAHNIYFIKILENGFKYFGEINHI